MKIISKRPKIFGKQIDFIYLFGRKIKIIFDAKYFEHTDYMGESDYSKNVIRLDPSIEQQDIEQSFCHEIEHWKYAITNNPKLNDDENFVDLQAHLLDQIIRQLK